MSVLKSLVNSKHDAQVSDHTGKRQAYLKNEKASGETLNQNRSSITRRAV